MPFSYSVEANQKVNTAMHRIFYPVGEIIRLVTGYLGLAVLVAGILILSMPPLRTQVQHVHGVFVAALKPGGYRAAVNDGQPVGDGTDVSPLSLVSSALEADDLPWPVPSDTDPESIDTDVAGSLPHLSFARVLADMEEQFTIPGVTATQAEALRSYIARKYRIAGSVTGALIATVFTVGRDMDLDPQLLLAVIAIESRYNPYAESHMGAQGLMQVMTRVHKDKFAALGEGPLAALHPLANIRVGAQILSDCIRRRGSLDGGLACYVGATGPGDGGYGAKVKAERRRIALASGIPIEG